MYFHIVVAAVVVLTVLGARKAGRGCFIAALLLVALPFTLYWGSRASDRLSSRLSRPELIDLGRPELLVEDLGFGGDVDSLCWSPTGRYIAIGRAHGVAVVDAEQWAVIARLSAPSDGDVSGIEWTAGDRLWVFADVGSDDVYGPPFTHADHTRCEELAQPDAAEDSSSWVRRVDSRTHVVVSGAWEYSVSWDLEVWRAGKRLCRKRLRAKHGGANIRPVFWDASPDGRWLPITVEGDFGMDMTAVKELWVLEVNTGELRFLGMGRAEWPRWEDYLVQDVSPSWDADSRTVVFGDETFGIEQIDVVTRKRKRILHPDWAGNYPMLSPSSRWICFYRSEESVPYPQPKDEVVVASGDGKRRAVAPDRYSYMDESARGWHPTEDVLAWVAPRAYLAPLGLYVWRIEERAP